MGKSGLAKDEPSFHTVPLSHSDSHLHVCSKMKIKREDTKALMHESVTKVVLCVFLWFCKTSHSLSSLTSHSLWPATSLFMGIISSIFTLTPTFLFIYINKDIKCFFKTFSSSFSYLHLNHNLKRSLATTRRSCCSGFPLILEGIFVSLHFFISYFALLLNVTSVVYSLDTRKTCL